MQFGAQIKTTEQVNYKLIWLTHHNYCTLAGRENLELYYNSLVLLLYCSSPSKFLC